MSASVDTYNWPWWGDQLLAFRSGRFFLFLDLKLTKLCGLATSLLPLFVKLCNVLQTFALARLIFKVNSENSFEKLQDFWAVKMQSKFSQNSIKMPLKYSQNAAKMQSKCSQNAAKMQPKFSQFSRFSNCIQKSIKTAQNASQNYQKHHFKRIPKISTLHGKLPMLCPLNVNKEAVKFPWEHYFMCNAICLTSSLFDKEVETLVVCISLSAVGWKMNLLDKRNLIRTALHRSKLR